MNNFRGIDGIRITHHGVNVANSPDYGQAYLEVHADGMLWESLILVTNDVQSWKFFNVAKRVAGGIPVTGNTSASSSTTFSTPAASAYYQTGGAGAQVVGVGYEWFPNDANGQPLEVSTQLIPLRSGISTLRDITGMRDAYFKNLSAGGDEMVLINSKTGKLHRGTMSAGSSTQYVSINCVGYQRQIVDWLVGETFHMLPSTIEANRITEIVASYGDQPAGDMLQFELVAEDTNGTETQIAQWDHTAGQRIYYVNNVNGIVNTATDWSGQTLRVKCFNVANQNFEGSAGYTVTIKLEV